jgi:hypothetical protein
MFEIAKNKIKISKEQQTRSYSMRSPKTFTLLHVDPIYSQVKKKEPRRMFRSAPCVCCMCGCFACWKSDVVVLHLQDEPEDEVSRKKREKAERKANRPKFGKVRR